MSLVVWFYSRPDLPPPRPHLAESALTGSTAPVPAPEATPAPSPPVVPAVAPPAIAAAAAEPTAAAIAVPASAVGF